MLSDWSDHLAIDHAAIDRDHKNILAAIDRLYQMPDTLFTFEEIEDRFLDILDFMAIHFAREEGLMKDTGYPDLEAHTREHDSLLQIYSTFFYERDARAQSERRSILSDLSMILFDHIKEFDRPLARFCRESATSSFVRDGTEREAPALSGLR